VLQRKLGQRIAKLRKARRLTQEQLAEAIGCSVEFISLLKTEVKELFNFEEKKR
jgi:transcriptional regulator with XRE-family HTH domain